MKKFSPAFVLLIVSFLIVLFSCKKINEATDLGGNLIPGVDNVNTFEVSLNTVTKNLLTNDSARVAYSDQVALGDIVDPEFGHIHANFCFNLSAPAYGSYPFLPRKDTIHTIDSVVLSIRYSGAYGDTLANGIQTVSVYEIPYSGPNSSLRSDTTYRYNDPSSDFNGGAQVGSKTFAIRDIDDSVTEVRAYDTFKVANVVRIKLNNSIGDKLAQLATDSAVGGYYKDSLFKTFFNGLQIKANGGGNSLSYFNLSDTATKLIVYYRYNANGKDTARAVVQFSHTTNGQTNYVKVEPGSNWATALSNGSSDKVYIQSSPSGSYASIVIPDLNTLSNRVIHRAEIIATKIPSAGANTFTPPVRLFLDRIKGDSSYLFERDLLLGSDGSIGYTSFGGTLKNDSVRFDITRYVQGIVTRHERNDTLRLWAPLKPWEYSKALGTYVSSLPVNNRIAEGRIVLGGGTYTDPKSRLRLRIVYSNL